MSDLRRFRADLKQGLAKGNRFEVMIIPPPSLIKAIGMPDSGFKFRCSDAELAGQSLNTMDFRYYGPMFKTPNQAIYSDLNLTFLTDENLRERMYFYDWYRYIIGQGSYDFEFPENYRCRIILDKINEFNNITMSCAFIDAFPINIAPIPLSWADDNFIRTMVQFSYTDTTFIRM